MLEGFLSGAAAELYQRLLLTPDGLPEDGIGSTAAVVELQRLGLVFRTPTPGPRVVPVAPQEAFERLLDVSRRETRAALHSLGRLLADLDLAHRYLADSALDSGPPIEVIEDPVDIQGAVERLRAEATEEYLAVIGSGTTGTPPLGWPVVPESSGLPGVEPVRLRCVAAAVPLVPDARCRVLSDIRMDARIVDGRRALVALPDASGPALLVRSPPAAGLLRRWFELLWQRGEAGGPAGALAPYQRRILTLMATGYRDAQIARLTGTSTRTVRRHITAMMQELGVSTRFEAGVAARRRGWLEPQPASAVG